MAEFNTYKLDYESLTNWMHSKDTKKLAHNTYIRKEDNKFIVKYHDTDIVILSLDSIVINTGGYFTVTTKQRINEFINVYGYNISQVNYEWIIYQYKTRKGEYKQTNIGKFNNNTCEYNVLDDQFYGLQSMDDPTRKEDIKSIKNYAKQYIAALVSGDIEKPSGGDCWSCYFGMPDNFNHIESHIEELYYVPSLILRAIEFKPISQMSMHDLYALWQNDDTIMPDLLKIQAYKSLYAYMLHCYNSK